MSMKSIKVNDQLESWEDAEDTSVGAFSFMSKTTVTAVALNNLEAVATLLNLQVKPISWLLVNRGRW
jgi:hypothetical protein